MAAALATAVRQTLGLFPRQELTIKEILTLRATLKRDHPQLWRQLLTYRVTPRDASQSIEDVAFLVSLVPGPIVRMIPGKGYGLVAERDYPSDRNTIVTRYNGFHSGPYAQGDYVVQMSPTATINGEYEFLLTEKGRWVNEPMAGGGSRRNAERQNVDMRLAGTHLALFTIRDVPTGTELLWNYGKDYHRNWLQ